MTKLLAKNGLIYENSKTYGITPVYFDLFNPSVNNVKTSDEIILSASVYSKCAYVNQLVAKHENIRLSSALLDIKKEQVLLIIDFEGLTIISNQQKIDHNNKQFKQLLKIIESNFEKYFKDQDDTREFLMSLFNYDMELNIINCIEKNDLNEGDFKYINVEHNLRSNLIITFEQYFLILADCLKQFVSKHYQDEKITIITPFTNSHYFSTYYSYKNINFINELNFDLTVPIKDVHWSKSNFEFNTIPTKIKSGWILLDKKHKELLLQKENGKGKLTINSIFDIFQELVLGNDSLLKIHVEFISNHLGCNCIKFTGINQSSYYLDI